MSKYSFEEKYQFNKTRAKGCNFSAGYCLGADLYEMFPRQNAEFQSTVSEFISTAKENATAKIDTDLDAWNKGVMCGYRDAANERKARAKQRDKQIAGARADKHRFSSY